MTIRTQIILKYLKKLLISWVKTNADFSEVPLKTLIKHKVYFFITNKNTNFSYKWQ